MDVTRLDTEQKMLFEQVQLALFKAKLKRLTQGFSSSQQSEIADHL